VYVGRLCYDDDRGESTALAGAVCRCFSARRRLSVEGEAYKYIEVEALFWRSSMLPPQITGAVAQTTDWGI
jgi:hypothetical protein